MAYTFDQIFAADPANPTNVAANAAITIFAPGDATMTPLTITTPDGSPLSNPVTVNANGFGSAFAHATLDRVAWAGGGFSAFFTSYDGMKNVAVAAQAAAEAAGATAAAAASAGVAGVSANADAAAASAAASATAAANSAALVGAPADSAIAAAVNGSATATKAALNATYAPSNGSPNYAPVQTYLLEGVAAHSAGHSFGVIQHPGLGNQNTWKTYFDRVQDRLRCGAYVNHNVSSSMASDALLAALGYWTPGTRSFMMVDITTNDVGVSHASAAGQQAYKDALYGLLYLFRAGQKFEAEAVCTSNGTWSSITDLPYSGGSALKTTSQGASQTFQVTGVSEVGVVLYGTVAGTTGGTATITVDGATTNTVNLDNRAVNTLLRSAARFPMVTRVALPNTGTHTVVISKSDAGAGEVVFDSVLTPSNTPPLIVLSKAVYQQTAGYARYTPPYATDADTDAFNGYLQTVVNSFNATDGSIVSVDHIGSGWNTATMCSSDAQHPNDLGNALMATNIMKAIAKMSPIPGTNYGTNNSQPGTVTQVTGPPAQVTGLTANGGTAGGTSVVLAWAGQSANPAITDYTVQYRTTAGPGTWTTFTHTASTATTLTVTGLTTGTSYDFHVAGVNAQGTGAYSANATATPIVQVTTYAADTFTRADSASLGSTETGAFAWTANNPAIWSISGNTMAAAAFASGTNPNDTYISDGQADGTIQVTRVTNPSNTGISFRCVASQNTTGYIFWNNGGVWTLSKRTASNSYSALGTGAGTPTAGDVIKVVLNGSSIVCKVNGTTVITATDATYNGTKHGLWTNAGAGATTYDAFSHTDQLV